MMLPRLLEDLLKQVVKTCEEWRRSGKIHKESRIYIKQKIEEFEYKEGRISCSWSFPLIEREEWSLRDIFNLMDTIKNQIPEYKKASETIAEMYNITESQAEFWLSRFVQLSLMAYLKGELDSTDMIVTFIGDLEDNPREWKIETWLEGVWMAVEKINIEKGVIIRKPQKMI